LTSGIGLLRLLQHATNRFHGFYQTARHFVGAIIETLGAGRGFIEFGGKARPLMHETLGIHFDALLTLDAASEVSGAGFETSEGAVEARRG
jgi:hypothetical protein